MMRDSATGTQQLDLELTCDVRQLDEEARIVRIAMRRCVRNAAGQSRPRNQFERYVADRLDQSPHPDHLACTPPTVSQLADELFLRFRERLLPGPRPAGLSE